MTSISNISSDSIKAEALRLGFSACGIARVDEVDADKKAIFKQWLADGKNANMDYMNNYEAIRFNPALLLDGCKSIICVALNYYPSKLIAPSEYQLAYYVYGKDYHDIMRAKLQELAKKISENLSTEFSINTRVCVDSAPILERYWAQQSGLGWIGKNQNVIIPHHGSFVFLGELLIDAEVDNYDSPIKSHCGTCRKCIDVCPNHAICVKDEGQGSRVKGRETKDERRETKVEGREAKVERRETKVEGREAKVEGREAKVEGRETKNDGLGFSGFKPNDAYTSIDANRCLSYLTIEKRGYFSEEEKELVKQTSFVNPINGKETQPYIYGCDRCQLVCPHNKFAKPNTIPEFQPSEQFLSMTKDDWHNLTREDYQKLFKGSACKRAKYEGLVRNIKEVENRELKSES